VHGEDFFHFGDKVSWRDSYRDRMGSEPDIVHRCVVLWKGFDQNKDCLMVADHTGAITLIHPRLLDAGWL
jgi:hypothetical protein